MGDKQSLSHAKWECKYHKKESRGGVRKYLGPGFKDLASRSGTTFRWCPFQSALSGSLFFIPPALPEVYDLRLFRLS